MADESLQADMVLTRIRVRFDFTPVNYARKCWFVFDSDQCSLVGDVAYLISAHFELQNNQEHNGIEVSNRHPVIRCNIVL